MKRLEPVELNAENFKAYGYVISSGQGQPASDNDEFKYWGKVSRLYMSETASTGVLIGKKRDTVVTKLERHVRTPEILVAVEGDCVICVANQDVQAFYVKQGDAFALYEGTWHWIPYPVDRENCKLLVIFAEGTEDNDLEVKVLDEEVRINI